MFKLSRKKKLFQQSYFYFNKVIFISTKLFLFELFWEKQIKIHVESVSKTILSDDKH